MIWATPVFFSAPWVEDGQLTVSPLPSFQASGAAAARNLVKLLVVPEPSGRRAVALLHQAVRAGEVVEALAELLLAGAGPDRVVGHGELRGDRLQLGDD